MNHNLFEKLKSIFHTYLKINQSLGQEQEEPPKAHVVVEESLHRRVEVVRNTASEDQAKESVGKDTMLVEGLGPRQSLGGHVRRGGQDASARRSSQCVKWIA